MTSTFECSDIEQKVLYNNYEAAIVLEDDYSTRVTGLGEGRTNVGQSRMRAILDGMSSSVLGQCARAGTSDGPVGCGARL